jgi:hypothetical protein
MTRSTTAYTHRRARPVHGEKVLGCGWPETSVTPDSEGRVPREVVVERAGKQLHGETQIVHGERVTVALGEILRLGHLSSWPANTFGAQDGPRW